MKNIVLTGWMLLVSFFLYAQGEGKGVQFMDNAPWKEVVKEAKKQNKMIFVDCYTTWCGPCKDLAATVFPREDVGNLINKHFVSVKYDVERGEGLAFAKEHREYINAFPTLLMIKPDGEVFYRMVGAYPTEMFMKGIQYRLDGITWQDMEKEYNAGKRDFDFVMDYLDVLVMSEQPEKYEEVKRDYIRQFPLDSLMNPKIWALAEATIDDPASETYNYVLQHINEFASRGFNRYDLEWKLSLTYYYEMNRLINLGFKTENADTLGQIQERLQVLEGIAQAPVKNFPGYLACVRVEESYLAKDYQEMFYRLIYLGENNLLDNLDWVYAWADDLLEHLSSQEQLRRCVDFLVHLQQAEEKDNDWVAENGYPVIAKAYEKLGEHEKAQEAIRLGEALEKQNEERMESFGF